MYVHTHVCSWLFYVASVALTACFEKSLARNPGTTRGTARDPKVQGKGSPPRPIGTVGGPTRGYQVPIRHCWGAGAPLRGLLWKIEN